MLDVLRDDPQAGHWRTADHVFWGAVLDRQELAGDELVAWLYHRFDPDGLTEDNEVWSIASNFAGSDISRSTTRCKTRALSGTWWRFAGGPNQALKRTAATVFDLPERTGGEVTMRSQVRFAMHPDDEDSLLRVLLKDPSILLIDGPRWKGPRPEASRSIVSFRYHCIIWSPEDLPELNAEFIPTCNDWYCRSEHSTIQFLRSSLIGSVLIEGRFAISTDDATARVGPLIERRYKMLRNIIKKTYLNRVVEWRNPFLPMAPASPTRSANPSDPDASLWVGPAAMAWLSAEPTRCIKQFESGSVEGLLTKAGT